MFGAAIADRLAGEGFDVTLIERAEPGHAGAESGGESRLLRCAHGQDALYTRSAWRARELWGELEAELRGPERDVHAGLVLDVQKEERDRERECECSHAASLGKALPTMAV